VLTTEASSNYRVAVMKNSIRIIGYACAGACSWSCSVATAPPK
jgi:hypothetical protein